MLDLGLMIALALAAAVACGKAADGSALTPTGAGGTAGTPVAVDPCQEHLDLFVSLDGGRLEERALVTSYQCLTRYVDSTSHYPPESPSLVLASGALLSFQLISAQQPVTLDMRLYSGARHYGYFLRWPEEFPTGVQPLDAIQPEPSTAFEYLPQQPPGDYSLVIRAVWDGPRDIFYAISFTLE